MDRACGRHGRVRHAYKSWSEKLMGRDHLEDLGMDGKVTLEWMLEKLGGRMWT